MRSVASRTRRWPPACRQRATPAIRCPPRCADARPNVGRNGTTVPRRWVPPSAPPLLHGPLVFPERPDYIGYYEYSSEAADKASVAPSGTAVHVQVYRMQRDPEADRFSVSGSGGYYDAASGARVGRSQFNWERGRIVRHRNGVDYMFDSATTAWLFNDLIEGQVVRSGVAWRSVTLSGYRADGSPTYAGQDIGCST